MSHFKPAPQDSAYYALETPAIESESACYTTFIQPFWKPKDPTHGRDSLPHSPFELALRNDPAYEFGEAKVYLDPKKSKWANYQWYSLKMPEKRLNADIVCVHGVNDYGGKWTMHVQRLIEAGYRLILPDLIGHGRSTGLHAYVSSMDAAVRGLDAVIQDVDKKDLATRNEAANIKGDVPARKRFFLAASMGGCVALLHVIRERAGWQGFFSDLVPPMSMHGMILLCPMLEISPASQPGNFVVLLGRVFAHVAGRWPLAVANKGKGATPKDAYVTEEWEMDPQTYDGKLRIATGMSCVAAMKEVNAKLDEVQVPFKVFHGTDDQVTSPSGSKRLFEMAGSTDKEIKLYPGLDHILLRKGRDDADDAERQGIISEILEWLNARQ